MSNLDHVRAEIKSWERDFASKHGRDPSVRDIKDQPLIAEKYKLYKKLSKTCRLDPVPSLPRINPFSPVKKTSTKDVLSRAANTTAISRARKRLRGEPVSPSPNKPKRQRTHAQVLPSNQDSSDSEHETDQELPRCDFASSFVADSPVKVPAGGKSFKLLFNDVLPALSIPNKPIGSSLPLLDSPDTLFSPASTVPPVATSHKLHRDLTSKSVISASDRRVDHIQSKIFPTHSASSHMVVVSAVSQPRTSLKRALNTVDLAHEHTESGTYSLIPPSPPPQDSINRDTGKAKAKIIASRKKIRIEDEESDEGLDDITLKVNTLCSGRDRPSHRYADDIDWDPLLHLGTRNHDPAVKRQIDANHHVSDTFTVNLPDKFHRVLAISPSRSQNSTEERVVRGLLYGDRVGHYDPSRGGDIWDAGETVDTTYGDVETEDDWEGEPVPWEVGEL